MFPQVLLTLYANLRRRRKIASLLRFLSDVHSPAVNITSPWPSAGISFLSLPTSLSRKPCQKQTSGCVKSIARIRIVPPCFTLTSARQVRQVPRASLRLIVLNARVVRGSYARNVGSLGTLPALVKSTRTCLWRKHTPLMLHYIVTQRTSDRSVAGIVIGWLNSPRDPTT